MNLRCKRLYTNKQIRTIMIFMAIIIGFSFILFYNLKSIYSNDGMNNILYAHILNFEFPIVKANGFDEDEIGECELSITDALLRTVGLNMDDTASLPSGFLSYFKLSFADRDEDILKEKRLFLAPFKLEDTMISKAKPDAASQNISSTSARTETVNVYDPKLKSNSNTTKPQVLIYHTHTTESYKPSAAFNDDGAKNITAVGAELKNELEKNYGIGVIHDKTSHVQGSYIKAYARSRETIDKHMKQYGDFKLIIDMHRDGGPSKRSVTTNMNGNNVARFMFVLTKENPHFARNKSLVNNLIDISNRLFPDFYRETHYFNYGSKYFNQDKSNNAVLLEVGGEANTLDEAKESTKYLARIIAEYINRK